MEMDDAQASLPCLFIHVSNLPSTSDIRPALIDASTRSLEAVEPPVSFGRTTGKQTVASASSLALVLKKILSGVVLDKKRDNWIGD